MTNNKIKQRIQFKRSIYEKQRRRKYLYFKYINRNKTNEQKKIDKLIKNSAHQKPPMVFSLKENTNATIIFINNLKKLEDTKQRIYINMKEVHKLTGATIALLLSVVNEFSSKGIKIIGSKPKNKEARKILELSGFFDHMNGEIEYSTEVNSNTIIEQDSKSVQPQRTAKIVRSAMKTITGTEQRNKKLQGLFIEFMANSINHGFPDNKNKKWILSSSHFKKENYVSFSFIDNGVGILETINKKTKHKLKAFFKGDQDLLMSAFKGDIGSRTGLTFRGKGLPFILKKLEENSISNLFILTNNVILDFENKNFIQIDTTYRGTFYYFELNKNNKI